jgi:hypothetical protein
MFVTTPTRRGGQTSRPLVLPPELIERTRPVSTSEHQLLPLSDPFCALLPGGGLRRGTTVTLDGGAATSLVLGLAAGPTRAGSWCAAVGWPELGAEAAHGLGVDLRRLVLVPAPGPRWVEVVGQLLLGLDLVVFRPAGVVKPALARRLGARAREQRVVLMVVTERSGWPEGADVHLRVESRGWEGIEQGSGYLRRRRVEVMVSGRRAQGRAVSRSLWLPDTGGIAGAA